MSTPLANLPRTHYDEFHYMDLNDYGGPVAVAGSSGPLFVAMSVSNYHNHNGNILTLEGEIRDITALLLTATDDLVSMQVSPGDMRPVTLKDVFYTIGLWIAEVTGV